MAVSFFCKRNTAKFKAAKGETANVAKAIGFSGW